MKAKYLKVFFSVGVILTIISGWIALQWPDQYLHVTFCDVGQGDGIILSRGFFQVLIDAGPDGKILNCLKEHMPFWDRQIEVAILTHAHEDHVGGFPQVLDFYRVRQMYLTGIGINSQRFRDLLKAIKTAHQHGTLLLNAAQGMAFSVGGEGLVKILSPLEAREPLSIFTQDFSETQLSDILEKQQRKYKSINDESIALFLSFGAVSCILTGDLEQQGELALEKHSLLTDVDCLKAGHHGSKTSSSRPFLQVVRPEVVVVSAGKKNTFGHPHREALDNFRTLQAKVLRTDQLGVIEMITDGHSYWWKTQKGGSQ